MISSVSGVLVSSTCSLISSLELDSSVTFDSEQEVIPTNNIENKAKFNKVNFVVIVVLF